MLPIPGSVFRYTVIGLIGLLAIAFPANIIGCVEVSNAYDEYISFFRNDLSPAKKYAPFYYVEELNLYQSQTASVRIDLTGDEWSRYCHHRASSKQASDFVYTTSLEALASLRDQLSAKPYRKIAPAVQKNPLAQWLLHTRNLSALDYLFFLGQAEGYHTTETPGSWQPPLKDSLAMAKLIDTALSRRHRLKDGFLRVRYAFQAQCLAFYSNRSKDCIRYYDQMIASDPVGKAFYAEGLSYKAGALYHLGKKWEAAYDFSRSFSVNHLASDYISFGFCVNHHSDISRAHCLPYCRNNREKADLLGLFLLGSVRPETQPLMDLAKLSPDAPIQEVLATREVNKIERNYLTPHLSNQKGGANLTMLYLDELADNELPNTHKWLKEAKILGPFYDSLAQHAGVKHPALYETISAYLAYLTRQYSRADTLLTRAESLDAKGVVRDQQKMIRILLTISQYPSIDESSEKALMQAILWLERKAKKDSPPIHDSTYFWDAPGQWQQFYRNLFSQILARRYYRQHDSLHEVLCIGAADAITGPAPDFNMLKTLNLLRNNFSSSQLLALWKLQHSGNKSAWDRHLYAVFPLDNSDERILIGTALIRENKFGKALRWLKHVTDTSALNLPRNPFGVTLGDWNDSLFRFDKGHFDKISFLKEMDRLITKDRKGKATANELFQLATGYYNMTYYGRAWEVVTYYRRSVDGYSTSPPKPTAFQKEYYGCYAAERYYRKAMNASSDKEFKARCLFLMGKCAQKQDDQPANSEDQKLFELQVLSADGALEYNRYFPRLVRDYSNTAFYREAFNTCSYLRDFVEKK